MSKDNTKYVVTGTLVSGKRFEAIHTDNFIHAMSINLYRGNVWKVDENGKRKVIKSVWN